MKATLWTEVNEDKGVPCLCIKSPYKATFTDQIKRDLPKGTRWFDVDRKVWCVDLAYRHDAEAIVREHYEEVAIAPEVDSRSAEEVLQLRQQITNLQQQLQYTQAGRGNEQARELRRLQSDLLGVRAEAELLRAQNRRLQAEVATARFNGVSHAPASRRERSPYDILAQVLPPEDLKRLYKLAIGAVHPDRGGSTKTAQDVNEAWEKIKREKGI